MSLEKVKAAIRKFDEVRKKYQDKGAFDTEPDGVFQSLLVRACTGKPYTIPNTGQGWQLYSNSETAAKRLHTAAKRVCDIIEKTPLREGVAMQEWLEEYCWRACWW